MAIDFSKVEFDDRNPEPRCPCVLLLDTSSSMSGLAISELNTGLQALKNSLSEDTLAMSRVEVAIITFGPVTVTQDFVTADQFVPPTLESSGNTPMGTAINLALDKVNERKQIYSQHGTDYYRPWVFLITDGAPTDGNVWQDAAKRVREDESGNHVAFFSVGVEGADMSILEQISTRQPLKLRGLNFQEMFLWLSNSLRGASSGEPDEDVPLQSPMGWGKVEGRG